VPGWTRFAPAEDWLKRAVVAGGASDATRPLKAEFDAFLDQLSRGGQRRAVSAPQKEALFAEFLRWRDAQPTQRQ
jgi:hypothetical protein